MQARLVLSYKEWAEALVRHFFGAALDAPKYRIPVRHLAVSDHQIQLAAGNRHPSPEDARRDLVRVFQHELGQKKFESVYQPGGRTPPICEPPESIVPLLVSCLVAAEYTTDDRYRDSFDVVCGNGKRNDTLTLPGLWRELRDWLRACREGDDSEYAVRELILPRRPGTGWRNIFYTLALTFPSRRDRELLRDRLEPLATRDLDPGTSEVIAALEVEKRFTPGFRAFFDDFLRQGSLRGEHPFWHAVRETWREVAGLATDDDPTVRFCAWVVQDEVHPYALVENPDVAHRMGGAVSEAPDVDEIWRFVVTDAAGEPEAFVSEVLAGSVVMPGMARDVRRGIVALEARSSTLYEWTGGVPRAGNGIALLRNDGHALNALRSVVTARGGAVAEPKPTQFENWLFVDGVSFGPDADDAERLSVVTAPPTLRVVDGTGVRGAGGFLGHPVFLPRIRAEHAHRVAAIARDAGGGEVELRRDGDSWSFPLDEFRGRWIVQAEGEDGAPLPRLQVDFAGTPAHSEFRQPTDAQCDRLLVEGARRDVRAVIAALPCFPADGDQRPFPADGVVYLGPAVGAFSPERAPGFDWVADMRARTLSFVGDPSAPTPPTEIVLGHGAARMWRRCFAKFVVGRLPEQVQQAYEAYRRLVYERGLPRPDSNQRRPLIAAIHGASAPVVEPEQGVEHFGMGLAAAASTRSGIDEPELFHVLECAFGRLDWNVKWDIVRAWAEGGVIEPTTDARWPARRYFVRRPRLIFTDETKREAVVMGLLTPAVRERIEGFAREKKLRVDRRRSLSPWGPLLLSIADAMRLESDLQRHEGFATSEIVPVLDDAAEPVVAIVHGAPRALGTEDDDEAAKTWSADTGRFTACSVGRMGTTVRMVQRPREPDRYDVLRDGRSIWCTPSRTWAFLVATNLRRENPFVLDGGLVVVAARSGVRLPLALARALSARGASSGPRRAGDYAYWFQDRATALAVLRRLLPDLPLPTE